MEAEDQAVIVARLAGGAIGTLEVSKIATGAEDDLRLEINGDTGRPALHLMEPDFLEAYSLSDPDAPTGGTRGWKRIATLQRYGAPAVFPSPRSTAGWLARAHDTVCTSSFAPWPAGRRESLRSSGESSLQQHDGLRRESAAAGLAEGGQVRARTFPPRADWRVPHSPPGACMSPFSMDPANSLLGRVDGHVEEVGLVHPSSSANRLYGAFSFPTAMTRRGCRRRQ